VQKNLGAKPLYKKGARKMLVKLTTGERFSAHKILQHFIGFEKLSFFL
jgi:hypothetical protein